jgi:hypothetical protein
MYVTEQTERECRVEELQARSALWIRIGDLIDIITKLAKEELEEKKKRER